MLHHGWVCGLVQLPLKVTFAFFENPMAGGQRLHEWSKPMHRQGECDRECLQIPIIPILRSVYIKHRPGTRCARGDGALLPANEGNREYTREKDEASSGGQACKNEAT